MRRGAGRGWACEADPLDPLRTRITGWHVRAPVRALENAESLRVGLLEGVVACQAMFCARSSSATPVIACEAMFLRPEYPIRALTTESGVFGGFRTPDSPESATDGAPISQNIACKATTGLPRRPGARNIVCTATTGPPILAKRQCPRAGVSDHEMAHHGPGTAEAVGRLAPGGLD